MPDIIVETERPGIEKSMRLVFTDKPGNTEKLHCIGSANNKLWRPWMDYWMGTGPEDQRFKGPLVFIWNISQKEKHNKHKETRKDYKQTQNDAKQPQRDTTRLQRDAERQMQNDQEEERRVLSLQIDSKLPQRCKTMQNNHKGMQNVHKITTRDTNSVSLQYMSVPRCLFIRPV